MRFLALLLLAAGIRGQQAPDLAAQRDAMKRLDFLVGTWAGEASVTAGPRGEVKVKQTENVQWKLDGLILTIEGTGRNPSTGEVMFRAFATVAYDDAARVYRFRAYNDGRYLDTELSVQEKGFEWGYQAGPAKVRFTMKLNDKGEWTEQGEVAMNGNPPRQMLEMTVRKS